MSCVVARKHFINYNEVECIDIASDSYIGVTESFLKDDSDNSKIASEILKIIVTKDYYSDSCISKIPKNDTNFTQIISLVGYGKLYRYIKDYLRSLKVPVKINSLSDCDKFVNGLYNFCSKTNVIYDFKEAIEESVFIFINNANSTGNIYIYRDSDVDECMNYVAIGDGFEFAIGALDAGASAIEALEIVERHKIDVQPPNSYYSLNIKTGEIIDSMKLWIMDQLE